MSILNIAKTGLDSSRKSLETLGHNIANVSTKGFSRQRVHQQTAPSTTKDGLVSGRGTFVKSVVRIHDPLLERRLQRVISDVHYYNERSSQLNKIEDMFDEEDSAGLNNLLNKFYNTFRALANQPENEAMRSVVRDSARLIVNDFRKIHEKLNQHAHEIDQKMIAEINHINELIKSVAKINVQIIAYERDGEQAPDLRDRRDQAIKEISKSFRIKTYLDKKGNYNVLAENIGNLVVGGVAQELATGLISEDRNGSKSPGRINIFMKAGPSHSISDKFRGGAIASLLRVRNQDIKGFLLKLDQIAYDFANTVNSVHRRGYVNRNIRTDEQGRPDTIDSKGKTTGIDFFKIPKTIRNASLNIAIADEVEQNLSNIVTSLSPNSPGDNRVAIAISKLQHEKIMQGGSSTLEESYLQGVAKVGIESAQAKLDKEHANGILNQTKVLKERISGVSIDEETANMVRFQHAYDASAKVMQTAKEMFDTVLSIKR